MKCLKPMTIGLLIAALAGAAHATSLGHVWLKYSSVSPTQTGHPYVDGVHADHPYNRAVYIGKYNLVIDTSLGYSGEGDDLVGNDPPRYVGLGTFCADVVQSSSSAYLRYDIYLPQDAPIGGDNTPDGMGAAKAADLRKLFDNYLYGGDDLSWTSDEAAAFQASVWEIIYEDDAITYDINTGDFYIAGTASWLNTADGWLGSLSGYSDPDTGLRVLVNEGTQDYALTIPGLGSVPVIPEPLTLTGMFLGIGGVAAYIRKRWSLT